MTLQHLPGDAAPRITPSHMAHLVIRTACYREAVAWYRSVFLADVVFASDMLTFLTFDDEHHRVAIANTPTLAAKPPDTVGIDHIAFSYRTMGELLATYLRLKDEGILPFWCINHGPTTSLYYHDPEKNDIELQVNNYPDPRDCAAFFRSETFAKNPLGVEFDPDALVALWRGGASEAELCRQGAAALHGKIGVGHWKLPDA